MDVMDPDGRLPSQEQDSTDAAEEESKHEVFELDLGSGCWGGQEN